MSDPSAEAPTSATIRRAPRIGVFLGIGAALGIIATLILTSLYPADENVGFAATFGYFLLYGVPIGVALGAVVALVLDRVSRRRMRTVTVERERVSAPEPEPTDAPEPADAPEPTDEPEPAPDDDPAGDDPR